MSQWICWNSLQIFLFGHFLLLTSFFYFFLFYSVNVLCRWLVLAMAMLRFYIKKGTHKGLYRSIARTLKFFQTFALVEVSPMEKKSVLTELSRAYRVICLLGGTLCHWYVVIWYIYIFFLSIFEHTAINNSQWWWLTTLHLCCRNCEDFCHCHRGSSVFEDFHGLARCQ